MRYGQMKVWNLGNLLNKKIVLVITQQINLVKQNYFFHFCHFVRY